MNRIEQMKQVQKEGLELFTKKNADYGDAFAKYGVIGVLMRIEDKIQRSISISKNGVNLIDENIRDTLIDLHNYAAMALMLDDKVSNVEPNEVEPNVEPNVEPSEVQVLSPIILNTINSKSHHKYFFPEFIININYVNDEIAYLYSKDIFDTKSKLGWNLTPFPSGIQINVTDYKRNTTLKVNTDFPNNHGFYISWLNDYEILFNETPILRIIRSI